MDELERCPFCGGEPHWFHDIDAMSIECIDCSFSIGVTLNFDDGKPTIDEDEKKLAEIWNSVDRTKTPKKEEKEDDDDDDYI